MKKQSNIVLAVICLVFFVLTMGIFIIRNLPSRDILVERRPSDRVSVSKADAASDAPLIDINTADLLELQLLPGVGSVLAQRIVDYRSTVGTFSRLEELLNVEGIGNGKLEALLPYITLGGAT